MSCFNVDQDIEIAIAAAMAMSKRLSTAVAILTNLSCKPTNQCTLNEIRDAFEIIRVKEKME